MTSHLSKHGLYVINSHLIHTMVSHTSVKYADKLSALSEPLTRLNIHYFCYQYVSNNGGWFTLGNNSDWLYYCADNETHQHDPSLIKPCKSASGCFLPSTHDNQVFREALAHPAVDQFNISHSLAITKPTKHGCEYYFFAGEHDNQHLMVTYLNNLHFLKNRYIQYVRQFIAPFFNDCLDNSISLIELNNSSFIDSKDDLFQKSPIFSLNLEPTTSESPKVIPGQYYFFGEKRVYFTPRETDCLNLMFDGYTSAKRIAKQLDLSHRTVEEYLTNIRFKTDSQTTIELLKSLFRSIISL